VARVIILSFSDDTVAEKLVELKDSAERADNPQIDLVQLGLVVTQSEMEAMIARPTVFCRCTSGTGRGTSSKTAKFGWWIHNQCRKPHYTIVKNFIHNMIVSVGNDLLPELRRQQRDSLAADAPATNGNDAA
jgi:hypothetical protein